MRSNYNVSIHAHLSVLKLHHLVLPIISMSYVIYISSLSPGNEAKCDDDCYMLSDLSLVSPNFYLRCTNIIVPLCS